jgi:TetR/AcrR family transcriptional regulator
MAMGARPQELGAEAGWEGRRWELRSALRTARRAQEASRRAGRDPAAQLIRAGQALVLEGEGQFTVRQLAERAGVALQTFYRHFGSKDELLLAVLEENVEDGVEEMEAIAARESDPVEQLRVVIQLPILMSTQPESYRRLRFHARERLRLSELDPAESELAFAPYRRIVEEHLRRVDRAGARVRVATDRERDADLVMRVVVGYAHAIGIGALEWSAEECAQEVWDFCRAALWREPVPPGRRVSDTKGALR